MMSENEKIIINKMNDKIIYTIKENLINLCFKNIFMKYLI